METNILHFSFFTPSISPGSYLAEHFYIKCSANAAGHIIRKVSEIGQPMARCHEIAVFVCKGNFQVMHEVGGYTVIDCKANAPTLDMLLLNGAQNGCRLSHVVCFVMDHKGEPVESTIYQLGEMKQKGHCAL